MRVRKSGGAYTARGLTWFGMTGKQAMAASGGKAVRGVEALLQRFDVRLKDGTLVFASQGAQGVYGQRKRFKGDTLGGRLAPPGIVAGDNGKQGDDLVIVRLWKDGALDTPLPLDLAKGKTHHLACLETDQFHYTCYIPEQYDPATATPVLMNFSPGGNAKPLSTTMADELGWIMVGLTESKNGPVQPSTANRDAVLFDLRRRFRVHPRRLYFSGFSGGARMASWSAIAYPCIGAGYLQGSPPRGVPVFFIVGKTDMNRAEVTRLQPAEAAKGRKTKLIVHPGGHSWGRKEDHELAVRWLDSLHKETK